jgi:hypothetical protein
VTSQVVERDGPLAILRTPVTNSAQSMYVVACESCHSIWGFPDRRQAEDNFDEHDCSIDQPEREPHDG